MTGFSDRFSVSRPNTLELSLPQCLRSAQRRILRDEFCDAVFRVLDDRAKPNIKCIQAAQNGLSFRLTLKSGCEPTRDLLLSHGIYLRGTFCYFMEAEASFSTVIFSNIPAEVPDGPLSDYLNYFFGDVKSVTRNLDKYGIETGDRRVLIRLRNHIPHCLKLGNFYVFVKYKSQPLVCFHCNEWGHKNSECPRRRACPRCGDDHRVRDCHASWELPSVQPVDENESAAINNESAAVNNESVSVNNNSTVIDNNIDVDELVVDEEIDSSLNYADHNSSLASPADGLQLLAEYEASQSLLSDPTKSPDPSIQSVMNRSFSSVVQDNISATFSPPMPFSPQPLFPDTMLQLRPSSLKRLAENSVDNPSSSKLKTKDPNNN